MRRPGSTDMREYAGLIALYFVTRLPLVFDEIPGWYRTGVQLITMTVAVGAAKNGIPPEYVMRQSFSGANLHGIFGAPLLLLGLDVKFVRLVMFVAGLVTLYFMVHITDWTGLSRKGTLTVLALLVLTPHFVLYTGYATPMAVTLCFATGSVFAYTRYLESERGSTGRWAAASGVLAGLATFNHFWGGIATLTILLFDAIVIWAVRTETGLDPALAVVRRRSSLWLSHVLGLLPAGGLYVYYSLALTGEAREIFVHYGGYSIVSSPSTVVQVKTYLIYIYWILNYLPVLVPAVAICGYLLYRTDPDELVARIAAAESVRASPLVFWSGWLAMGLAIVVIFPRGTRIHDYYFWWTMVPSIGIVGWVFDSRKLDHLFASRNIDPGYGVKVFVAGIVIVSASMTGYHVVRSHVDLPTSDVSVSKDDKAAHARDLASVFDRTIREEDKVIIYSDGYRLRLGLVLSEDVEISRTEFVHSVDGLSDPALSDHTVLVTTDNSSAIRDAGWRHVRTVRSHGYVSYVYRR